MNRRRFVALASATAAGGILTACGNDPEATNLTPTKITEGVIMRDVESAIKTLWQLKEIGVQLAIDDFGMGYSSLSYLKQLPLDILKIDRTFVHGIGHNAEDTAIVRAIIAMGQSLGLELVAEGVETPEQLALLTEQGCHLYQGYLFGRPVPLEEFIALLPRRDSQQAT